MIKGFLYSFSLACATILACVWTAYSHVAPHVPPVVGSPDLVESKTVTLPARAKISVRSQNGSVQVRLNEEDGTIRIAARLKGYGLGTKGLNVDGTGRTASLIDEVVSVESDASEIRLISLPAPDSLDAALFLDYEIAVPAETDIEIAGSNGNIRIAEGCGEVSVKGSNADIDIRQPLGNVWASSVNGRIRVTDLQGETNLETVNGNIYANVRDGSLYATSTNGFIEASVDQATVAACTLNSRNGGIRLRTDEDFPMTIEAASGKGLVRNELPLETAGGTERSNILQAIIGSGDLKLNLGSLNGNISIIRR